MAALQFPIVPATTMTVNDQTAQLLTDRLLLTERLTGYADQILLVTTGGVMGNDEMEIRLVLTALGFEDFGQSKLQQRFFHHLRRSLTAMVYGNWVSDVREGTHPDAGLPCVTVVINDYNFLGESSTDLVLREASVFLEVEANVQRQQVFTLAGDQRLVPLAFQVDDMYRDHIELTLSVQLELVRPRGYLAGVDYDSDRDKHGANYLKAMLELALDPYRHVTRIFVDPRDTGEESGLSPRGVKIRLGLDYGHDGLRQPTAADLKAIEGVITEVLRRHVLCKTGFFTTPVLVPAYIHHDVDDGDFDEDRYDEY